MRITRETLLKIARDTIIQFRENDHSIICAYLTGSLLGEDPLLGGSTDIDLFIIHNIEVQKPREIIPFSDEVHLDIAHLPVGKFTQPRNLRSDPWIGSYVCNNPLVLFEIKHWFEFTQAGVCAQFYRPDNVLTRSLPFAEAARRAWLTLSNPKNIPANQQVGIFLKALENVANSIACLSGPPLTERRFLLNLPERIAATGHPELIMGWNSLFVIPSLDEEDWQKWLKGWREDYNHASQLENCPPALHSSRLPYYERAIDVLRSDHPEAALWLLMHTWSRVVGLMPDNMSHSRSWQAACRIMQLDGDALQERLSFLDSFLDQLELTTEDWSQRNGV